MIHTDAGALNASRRRRRNNTIITTVCILLFLVHVAWNSPKYDDMVKLTQPHINIAETGSVAVQHVQEDRDKFSLASSQSYGFFDDVTDKHWKILQKIAVEHVNHKYPEQPLTHNPLFDKRKIHTTSYPAWWQTVSPTRELACSASCVVLGQEEAPKKHLTSSRITYHISMWTYFPPVLLIIADHHSCCCSSILHAIL